MLGWTHECLRNLITRKYGAEEWIAVLREANFEEDTIFEASAYYDDSDTFRIFRTCALHLGISFEQMWEIFGEFLICYAWETGWDKLLGCMAYTLQEFLDSLNAMHYFIDQIAFKSEMRGPTFLCEKQVDGSLRLHYYSTRQGLYPIVQGLVRQSTKLLFDLEICITVIERAQERRKHGLSEHVVFNIVPSPDKQDSKEAMRHFAPPTKLQAVEVMTVNFSSKQLVTVKDFCKMFPTHICFNKQLIVEHCGDFLKAEYHLSERKMTKLSDIVQLIQPSEIQLSFKSIQTYLNSLFIFQMKHHSQRNEVDASTSKAFRRPLGLKGQMLLINGGNSCLFLCSPYVKTVKDLIDLNICISDMQKHDTTRDLIMLNQSRICQMELNKRLEETSKRMKALADELEQKKNQTETLLLEFLPLSMVESYKKGMPIAAEEFAEATVLISILPDFAVLGMRCQPFQLVGIMDDLFHRIDRLIDIHRVHKVLNCLDSYFVVGGAPDRSDTACEQILNTALAMVMETKQIIVPELQLPLRVCIGVHCGPVVAGVVSHTRPRYCVLGETVSIAKRLAKVTEPSRILVTNATRMKVSKHHSSSFVFSSKGFVNTANHGATCTHYLEKNERYSVWELIGRKKGENQTSDGYKELHDTTGNDEWKQAAMNARKQQKVIDAMRPTRTVNVNGTRAMRTITTMKSAWRRATANRSNDSGTSSGAPESAVCRLM